MEAGSNGYRRRWTFPWGFKVRDGVVGVEREKGDGQRGNMERGSNGELK
jgi:hypothetical protein